MWGEGRWGWNIECPAMAKSLLGETIDIHGGGQDLCFPHHEDEIAQSETANGQQFAKYWLHNGFVLVNAEKMAKSLGNFTSLRDAFVKFDPHVIRYFLASVHYRAPINFTPEALDGAKQSFERLQRFYEELPQWKLPEKLETKKKESKSIIISKFKKDFEKVMDEDINVSKGLAVVFDFVAEVYRLKQENKLTKKDGESALKFLEDIDSIFAFFKKEKSDVPVNVKELLAERELARKNKDWKKSDELREEIKTYGFIVKDMKDGQMLERI